MFERVIPDSPPKRSEICGIQKLLNVVSITQFTVTESLFVSTDEKARGIVRFLCQPGDSGTLLFAPDSAELRFLGIAVFRGTEPRAGIRLLPQGCGALLPPF
jgi:hypothetical protein